MKIEWTIVMIFRMYFNRTTAFKRQTMKYIRKKKDLKSEITSFVPSTIECGNLCCQTVLSICWMTTIDCVPCCLSFQPTEISNKTLNGRWNRKIYAKMFAPIGFEAAPNDRIHLLFLFLSRKCQSITHSFRWQISHIFCVCDFHLVPEEIFSSTLRANASAIEWWFDRNLLQPDDLIIFWIDNDRREKKNVRNFLH